MTRTMWTFPFWRSRLFELVMAMMAVFLFTSYLDLQEKRDRESLNVEAWFEVYELYVPDHVEGSNPPVVYDREIKKDFRGFWVAEVQRRDQGVPGSEQVFAACTGSGVNEYQGSDVLPDGRVDWTWILGRACAVPPGTYLIEVTYELKVEGYPTKRYRKKSNVFTVSPGQPAP